MWIITEKNDSGDIVAINAGDLRKMIATAAGTFAELNNGETVQLSTRNVIGRIVKACGLHLPATDLAAEDC